MSAILSRPQCVRSWCYGHLHNKARQTRCYIYIPNYKQAHVILQRKIISESGDYNNISMIEECSFSTVLLYIDIYDWGLFINFSYDW